MQVYRQLGVFTILFYAAHLIHGDGSTIFIPGDTTRTRIGLVIIPGAFIGADQYIKLGSKIQNDSKYSLYLATVGKWIGNLVNPLQMGNLIDDVIKEMREVGLSNDDPIFIAAHSLGGVFLDMYIRKHPKVASGIILYGSYISKSVKLHDYLVPVLTMTGDQDGMCRMTRIAKDFGQLKKYTPRSPVVIVPGINHSEVASGKMPSRVEKNDLIADRTEDEAHALLSEITNAFLVLNGPQLGHTDVEAANRTLESYHIATNNIAKPFLEALQLDGGGNPSWAQRTAMMLSGIAPSNTTKIDIEGMEENDVMLMVKKPLFDKSASKVTVLFNNAMPYNPMDISLYPQTPNQQLIKTFAVHEWRRMFPNATLTDRLFTCNDTNYEGVTQALTALDPVYTRRYTLKGRQLTFLPDEALKNDIAWLLTNVKWDSTGNNQTTVTSPRYSNNQFLTCKVLTLSKIMEWILIDAFKKQH